MQIATKVLISLASMMIFAINTGFAAPKSPQMPSKNQCLVQLKVPDMACPMGCSPVVSKAIKSVKGVAAVEVIFEKRLARVIANKEACTEKAQKSMIEAVKKAGYSCEFAKADKPTQSAKSL